MGNLTEGACADCEVCYADGCTVPAADSTDGFGVLLDGLECELNALEFYGEMHCRTEALTAGYMTCFADPLETQFLGCMAADITAEYTACIANVSTVQVTQCVTDMVKDELLTFNDAELSLATAACEVFWLEQQESTCNTAALTIQDAACKAASTVADKQAGITAYAAEFGTIVAASQTYACANAGKTFSPTVRTKTPTLNTRSPTLKTNTPTIKTNVPTLRTKTPTLKTGSPVITTTPTLRTRSPTIKTKSPTRSPTIKTKTPVSGSPTVKSASPTGSPTIWTRVPTVRTKTPVTGSPTIKTKTPTSKTASPTGTPVSNSPSSSSPTIKTKAPVSSAPVSSSPTIKTKAPVTTTPTTKSPVKGTTATPTTKTPVSKSPTRSPTTRTKTPVSSSPTIRTRAPTLAPQSASPTLKTKAPVTATPVTTTPVSSSPTRSPTIKTKSPTIDTKTPTIKTKTPITSSPTGTPVSVSPTIKTRSPTRSPTGTPVSVAPTLKTKTPTLKTASPTIKTMTPTLKTTSPTLKTSSPTLKTSSPTIKTVSPTLKTTAPTLKTKSPTLKTKAPTTSPTTGPTVSTSSPTASPTTACYGKADMCKTGFLALFDYTMTSVHSAADVWKALNASQCTNSSYDMMQPFYANVMGCYLNQTSCTGTDSYSVTAKRILDNADSCNTDHTQTICSTTGVTGHTACAAVKTTCQAALDARTYNSTNMQGCSSDTIASATACNATKLACETCLDIDASGTCADCVNTTQIGFAACTTSKTGCNAYINSLSTNATGCTELTTYDATFLTDITAFATAITSCSAGLSTGDYSQCTTTQLAALLTCSNKGVSCGVQLGLQAAGSAADTVNCSATSLASFESQCVADIEKCLAGEDYTKCRLAQTVASATACYTNISMCTALRTDAYCTGDVIAQLSVCDSNLEVCAAGVFVDDPEALTADEQTALDTCATTNPEVIDGLQTSGNCWINNLLCEEYLTTMDTALAGTCDSISGFADSDYPTLNIWIDTACSNDAPRTAPPTAEPKAVLSVALKTMPTESQVTTVCNSMKTTLLSEGVIQLAAQLSCDTVVEQTRRRRLLNTTTTYKVTGFIKATQAAMVAEKLATVDQAQLAVSLSNEIAAADPVLAAESTIVVEPLETKAPTKMPTPAPTPAAPTSPPPPTAPTAAAVVPTPVYSSSERITPSLLAVVALSFLLL